MCGSVCVNNQKWKGPREWRSSIKKYAVELLELGRPIFAVIARHILRYMAMLPLGMRLARCTGSGTCFPALTWHSRCL